MLLSKQQSRILPFVQTAFAVLAIYASAQVNLPTYPVPTTLQTITIIVISILYSKRIANIAIVSYLLLGVMQFPVFAGHKVFLSSSPTLGYLFGFLICPSVVSMIENKGAFIKIIMCYISIYLPGILYLSTIIGLSEAFYSGFIVLLLPETLKFLIVYSLVKSR